MLSLYGAQPGPLTPQQLADALVLAETALQLLLDSYAGISGSAEYRPLDGLSDSRAEVYQATGMISAQLGVTLEEAFVLLRRYARDHNHPLTQLSGDVIRGTVRIAGDG